MNYYIKYTILYIFFQFLLTLKALVLIRDFLSMKFPFCSILHLFKEMQLKFTEIVIVVIHLHETRVKTILTNYDKDQ